MAVIEIGREAATLVMLLAVAAICGADRWERFLSLCIAFGVWDLFYYAWLWVFIQWPSSLFTWDILFLIPVPWIGPVLAPVVISVALVAGAGWLWHLKARGARLHFSPVNWTLAVTGGCLVLVAFMVDFEEAQIKAEPSAFQWGLFSAGLLLSLSGLVRGVSDLSRGGSGSRP